MKPDTAIAKQMILDANKNCAFTAEGRLVVKLPPKRRFKTSVDYARANKSDSLGEKKSRPFYRLKRSGHPHPKWKTKPIAPVTHLGFADAITEGGERFVSHLHLVRPR